MPFYQFFQDDNDDAIRIRDVVIPPLRNKPSSIFHVVRPTNTLYCDNQASDHAITLIEPKKKKKKKKKKRGLLSWLGGGDDEGCVVSTKSVIEPQQLLLRRQSSSSSLVTRVRIDSHGHDVDVLICVICKTSHQSTCFSSFNQGCCMCSGNGHSHELCQYQRHRHRHHYSHHHRPQHYSNDRHRHQHAYNGYSGHTCGSSYDDGYDDYYSDRHLHSHSHRHGRSRALGWDGPELSRDREMRRRGERYKNSTEYEWREELINLMAEQREEMSWERHHLEVMPEFEMTNFIYRDTQERNDRISHLTELLEQAKVANLQRDRDRDGDWDF